MKRLLLPLILAATTAYAGTVTGNLQGPSGLPVKNATINFNLQQAGLLSGTGAIVPTTASCYTSSDGSVVGIPNPLGQPITSINYGSGTLPAGIYYVEYAFYSGSAITLTSPEARIQLTGAGTLAVSPPATFPANATGMTIFIGVTSGGETGQGTTVTNTSGYSQSTPLGTGIPIPSINTSICSIAFNDTIIPFSGYNVSLVSSAGNAYPGWPQAWQLNGGLSGTVNISQGAPLWNGVTIYPSPVLMQPLNHGPQSVSGLINMTGYNLINLGALGIGTSTPAFPIDVENGIINSSGGFAYNGLAPNGHCLLGNGTAYVDSASCAGSGGQPYYYRWASNAVFVPQEAYANFYPPLVATDNAPGGRTDISIAASGVSAGSYTNASVTVNAQGFVTSISSGNAIPVIQELVVSNPCTTSTSAFAQCSSVQTWPIAFSNSSYALACTAGTPSAEALTQVFFTGKTASGFTLFIQNGDSSGANAVAVGEVDCIGIHP